MRRLLVGRRRRRTIATLGHELVELGLVLGVPQAIEESLELALLFLETLQRLFAILIERAVAADTGSQDPSPDAYDPLLPGAGAEDALTRP